MPPRMEMRHASPQTPLAAPTQEEPSNFAGNEQEPLQEAMAHLSGYLLFLPLRLPSQTASGFGGKTEPANTNLVAFFSRPTTFPLTAPERSIDRHCPSA